ncbi:alpha-2-macroglobulin family protein [Xanthocytophaga agilis]|uniref:Alpha-2-macroglobulin family protein n=1 Tax=Xanthocytophaga agilis TaxID=3048010 RepID=A0AAE3UI61_9BACT|nr:alpha-2-macroglobulin family protein [Xanthocytophaga agilis]MDJ1506175.1 alpha-2-macroglobulin family protein [Xanthocytophaga agilis]
MQKHLKPWLLVIGLILTASIESAYLTAPKDDILNQILKKLSAYQETYTPEKVYLHLDKPYYFSGEDIWFKAYVVSAMTHLTDSTSGVLCVDLLNSKGTVVSTEKIKLTSGEGHGNILLGEELPTATYQLRAYTRWMQNGKADFFFHKQISILNPNNIPSPTKSTDTGIDVQFFPEGGDLIENLESTIAFKVTDKQGKGIARSIRIISDTKDTMGTYTTMHHGIGTFRFTPLAGKSYQAVVQDQSKKSIVVSLPKPRSEGWVMHTDNIANNLLLSVQSTRSLEEKLYIVVQNRGKSIYQSEGRILNGKFSLQLPGSLFPTGTTQITLFDAQGTPQCERLVFFNQNDHIQIQLTSDKKSYLPREKVTLTLTARDAQGKPITGNFSMGVTDTRSFSYPEENILTNLLLTSDLKGNIEDPGFYFQNNNPNAVKALDNLMLTQGWRRFAWKEILQPNLPSPAYEHEPDIALTVRLLDKNTRKIIPAQVLLVSAPGTNSVFRYGYTNAEGKIHLNSLDFYDYRNVIVSIYDKELYSSAIVVVDSASSAPYSTGILPTVLITENMTQATNRKKIWSMIQQNHASAESSNVSISTSDTLRPVQPIYQKADDRIKLDDYTLFPTMEEVIRDIIPWGLLTHKKGQTGFRILNPDTKLYFKYNPLYLIDNVPIHNINPILSLDPTAVHSIESVRSAVGRGQFGEIGYYGIFSVFTKAGDFYPSNEPGLFNFPVRGFQKVREYYSPKYETPLQNQRQPDFRNLLYWNPSVQTDATGKATLTFYNSDDLTTWRIIAEGISKDGKPAMGNAEYTVTMDLAR